MLKQLKLKPEGNTLVVGVLSVTLYIGGITGLKDKRRVIKSILTKIQSKFNAAASETGRQDEWNYCEMGFSCVSNKAAHAESMLSSVMRFIDNDIRVEVIQSMSELLHY
jgi:uncharacterized protein YlxP (DUF503 family)